MKARAALKRGEKRGFLDGQMLVAMPGIRDPMFARSVIFICAHSSEGAMGLIVNKAAGDVRFPDLLVQLKIIGEEQAIRLPGAVSSMPVLAGGPVETGRGFVLHSADFFDSSSLPVDEKLCLTATTDVLRAIAQGSGPEERVLALGYAGWSAGQLESEVSANGWLHCAPDSDLIFGRGLESKYNLALKKLGIDPAMLSGECGHA